MTISCAPPRPRAPPPCWSGRGRRPKLQRPLARKARSCSVGSSAYIFIGPLDLGAGDQLRRVLSRRTRCSGPTARHRSTSPARRARARARPAPSRRTLSSRTCQPGRIACTALVITPERHAARPVDGDITVAKTTPHGLFVSSSHARTSAKPLEGAELRGLALRVPRSCRRAIDGARQRSSSQIDGMVNKDAAGAVRRDRELEERPACRSTPGGCARGGQARPRPSNSSVAAWSSTRTRGSG